MSLAALARNLKNDKRKNAEGEESGAKRFRSKLEVEKEVLEKKLAEEVARKEEVRRRTAAEFAPLRERERSALERLGEVAPLPEEKLRRKLRKLGEPVRLFGESEQAATVRYYLALELWRAEQDARSDHPLASSEARTLKEAATGRLEGEVLGATASAEELARLPQATFTLLIFRQTLARWAAHLATAAPDPAERLLYEQSRSHLRPLFALLEADKCPRDVLPHVFDIARNIHASRWVLASDAYLRLAIGNAPWPMGVTGVGIHERAHSDRIVNDKIAHVLNDDKQRKYCQAIKRLITFAQDQDTAGPSRKVGWK